MIPLNSGPSKDNESTARRAFKKYGLNSGKGCFINYSLPKILTSPDSLARISRNDKMFPMGEHTVHYLFLILQYQLCIWMKKVTSLYEYDLMVEFYQLSLFIIMFPPWKKQYHSTQKSKDKYSPSWRWISYGSTCNFALLITPHAFFFFWQWGYPLGIYPIGLIPQDTCTTYTRGLGCWQGSSWQSNWFQTNPTRIQLTLWTDWVTVQFTQL